MQNLRGPMMAQRIMQGAAPVMNGTRAPMPMAGAGPMMAPSPAPMPAAPHPAMPNAGGLGWLGMGAGAMPPGGAAPAMGGGPRFAGGFSPVYHPPPVQEPAAPNFLRSDDPAFQQMQLNAGSGGPGG